MSAKAKWWKPWTRCRRVLVVPGDHWRCHLLRDHEGPCRDFMGELP